MARISHKLKNSLEGALAGGGDPATSPLYVFGPFLSLIIASEAAWLIFGGAVWLAILTIAVVSAMYRLVMQWVTDGSGGSGLSEEEFGGWAVKVNAAITFVEYTLTFLVSMAAMVTFITDRFPVLNLSILGIQYRTLVAILLSLFTGWLVNRGPRTAARTFGPATAGVLIILWLMVFATIIRTGFHLPVLSLQAFRSANLQLTLGGYARILAVMTGIEVFANLVPAFDGTQAQKSRKSFQSLLIIMSTTAATMLIVGPAIFNLSDPANAEVSVFTQTMDQLLPYPLPLLGTLVGTFVLMSASAASAQGLQNLALGLKERHYIPPIFATQNKFEVAERPVWLEVGVVALCFLLFGTHEATYLSLYAAGVFILLCMTGWAVTKRLLSQISRDFTLRKGLTLAGAVCAAVLTSLATIIIFVERFTGGAWAYLVFIPVLYAIFTYFRNHMGAPSPEMDYLGHIDSSLLAGFGFGQTPAVEQVSEEEEIRPAGLTWAPDSILAFHRLKNNVQIQHIVTLLDGTDFAAQAIPITKFICETTGSRLTLLSAAREYASNEGKREEIQKYLWSVAENILADGIPVTCSIQTEPPAEAAQKLVIENEIDLVIVTTRGHAGEKSRLNESLSSKLVRLLDIPVLLVQIFESGPPEAPQIGRILIALDGSAFSEQVLAYARLFGQKFGCELMLICVPAVPESEKYRAPAGVIKSIRKQAESNMKKYVASVAERLRQDGLKVRTIVTGSNPARTIIDVGKRESVDLLMITSQGRGGLDLLFMGSVAEQVVQQTDSPVFILPINKELEE
jgi:nucleotide-binding universal stress UspA family protein